MELPHWRYFISLEDEIVKISRFVEISKDNYGVYSIELTKLFLSICSEVGVVAKLLCKEVDLSLFNKERGNCNPTIDTYRTVIRAKFPKFHEAKVKIPFYNLSFMPWEAFKDNTSPAWWKQYNGVKHERNLNFKNANLENVLSSMSGLMMLLVYLYDRQSVIPLDSPYEPKLYEIEDLNYRHHGARWGAAQLGVKRAYSFVCNKAAAPD